MTASTQDAVDRRLRFERWVRYYSPELYRVCLRRLGGRVALAEELLHDTFLVAWNKLEQFEGEDEGARRWLHRIAYLLTPGVWRKNKEAAELSPELSARVDRGLWLEGEVREADPVLNARLPTCFGHLSDRDRAILQMRFGLRPDPAAPELPVGLSYVEMGPELDALFGGSHAADQVRMRANRAMSKLKKCLEGDD